MTATAARRERWESHATEGACRYCQTTGLVHTEPFGDQSACFTCWEAICYGDEEDA